MDVMHLSEFDQREHKKDRKSETNTEARKEKKKKTRLDRISMWKRNRNTEWQKYKETCKETQSESETIKLINLHAFFFFLNGGSILWKTDVIV